MKLQILQLDFAKALSQASRFTSSKAQLPVLGNILLKTDRNKLIVGSTNLENSISIKVGAKVESEGSITVPSKVITGVVGNLKSESLQIQVDKETLKITSTGFRSNVSGMNASDFPKIPHNTPKESIDLQKDDFLDAVAKVTFAASSDEARPVLTGVLTMFGPSGVQFVATDGFRLSSKKVGLKGIEVEMTMILPKNTLSELGRIAGDSDTIKLHYSKNDSQVIFSTGTSVFSSRIIDGEFPDFEKIIPKSSSIKVSTDKEELVRAVKLGSVFASESANTILVSVAKDSLSFSTQSSQSGSQETSVEALVKTEKSLSKGFKIGFNYRFLEDILGVIKTEDVDIELSDPNSPGVFKDPKDKDFLHLIMPVKLS